MDDFFLEATPKTPRLYFSGETGEFEISGRSIPENSIEFYKPVINWLDRYITDPNNHTLLVIKLEYFNTSSSKCLVEILRRLESLKNQSIVKVKWCYEEEDEDMQESGEDFKEIIKVPIEMVLVRES
ncbi:MAG: hypothetical protein DHS20C17_35320 [Cyclobacteriaceae bacterium]|nr:MAG: hypothetical protein DHS20C17_35320 [Cyclobacteriaceae bacterium]